MDDEIRKRNEEASAELDEMFKRAVPIMQIWDQARGETGIGRLSKEEIIKIVLEVAAFLQDNIPRAMPSTIHSPNKIPQVVQDIAKIHDIWLRDVVGLPLEVEELAAKRKTTLNEALATGISSPNFPPQIPVEIRLQELASQLAYAQSVGFPFSRTLLDPVRIALESGFKIVARRLVEKFIAEGHGFEAAKEKIMAASKEIINPHYARTNEWIELEVRMLWERFVWGAKPSANRDGLTVDASAFEKRPVPKPEMPNGKTPKPIKR